MVKTFLANALLLFASTIIALLLFEALLRVTSEASPAPHFYRPHPQLGFEPVPGAAGWRTGENVEPVWFEFNQAGVRGPVAAEAERNAAETTVLFIGDSFTEGAQVPFDDTFVRRIEQRLRDAGRSVRGVNAGVSGYGTAQHLLRFEQLNRRFAPDLVVLGFCSGNDVSDSAGVFDPDGGVYYRIANDELLGPFSHGRQPSVVKEWLRSNTRLYPWAATIRQQLRRSRTAQQAIAAHGQVFHTPLNQSWREAWQINERLLAQLADAVRAAGAELVVAALPVGYQVYRDPRHHHSPTEDLYLVEKRLAASGSENGFLTIPLLDAFKRAAESTHAGSASLFFDNIGHFTAAGHQVVADVVAGVLAARR